MNINECYKKLNLSIDSSLEEVKKSYRKLAKIYHPDINPNGNEMFTSINEAYNYILEYKKNNNSKENNSYKYKKTYKTSYTSNRYNNNNYTYTNDSLWDDILNKNYNNNNNKNYNNNNHSYSQQVKGSNIFLEYKLTQEDFKSINNKDFIYKEIYYKKKSICMSCQGTGKEIKICPDCKGSGINKSNKNKVITNCNTCKGLGTVEGHSLCSICKGNGFIEKNTSVNIRIPLNIKNEFLITLPGKGNDDAFKNNFNNVNYLYVPGDLIIKIIPITNNDNNDNNDILDLGTIRLSLYDIIKGKTYIFNKENKKIRLFIKPKTKLGLKKIKDKKGNIYSFNLEVKDINYDLINEKTLNIIKALSDKNIV